MNIKSMKVSTRLALGFGTVFVLIILLVALGVSRVRSIESTLATINDVNSVKQRYAINFRGSVHDRAIAVRDVVLADSTATAQAEIAKITALAEKYAKSAGPLDQLFSTAAATTPEEVKALAAIISEVTGGSVMGGRFLQAFLPF